MKTYILCILATVAIFLAGCGGESEAEPKPPDKDMYQTAVKHDLKTQEGVEKTLCSINFDLPEFFSFNESKLNGGYYKVSFKSEHLDSKQIQTVKTWLKQQIDSKQDQGWSTKQLRDNEVIAGNCINEALFYPPKGEIIKSMTVALREDTTTKTMKMYLSIDQ